jgi:DNA-binding HxlR family transcriptional regulator
MSRTDTSTWPCTMARSADVLGDSWNLLIIRQACMGTRRFDEFKSALGIGRNILTNHLTQLVEQDLLARTPAASRVPPH